MVATFSLYDFKNNKKETTQCVVSFWWELVDSNHRSIKQQIYSLSPLATRESSLIQLSALDFRVLDYYSKGKSKMQAFF